MSAGWRHRQTTTVTNRGRVTTVMLFPVLDSEAYHVKVQVKEMGQQKHTTLERMLPFEDAYELYAGEATGAVIEEVIPPDTSRQIVGPFGDDDE
jgi:hypothetical protein